MEGGSRSKEADPAYFASPHFNFRRIIPSFSCLYRLISDYVMIITLLERSLWYIDPIGQCREDLSLPFPFPFPFPFPKLREAQDCVYLQAVIKEIMRFYSGDGLIFVKNHSRGRGVILRPGY